MNDDLRYYGNPMNWESTKGDLISREALIEEFKKIYHCVDTVEELANTMEDIINNIPTVEYTFEEAFQKTVCDNKLYCPARPKGEWYYNCQNGWHCSICHETVKDMPTVMRKADFNFCPNCGADMRGDKE